MVIKMTKKHKFNIIDALIIIVIAAIIAGAAFLLLRDKPEEVKQDTVTIEYVVEFRKVRDELKDNIAAGDTVIDSVAKYYIGEVVDVESEAALFTNGNHLYEGKAVVGTYPGYSDIRATIVCEATIGGNGRYILSGGYSVSVGSRVDVRTPNYNGTGYCISLRESEVE